jgi:hypothetical protein
MQKEKRPSLKQGDLKSKDNFFYKILKFLLVLQKKIKRKRKEKKRKKKTKSGTLRLKNNK